MGNLIKYVDAVYTTHGLKNFVPVFDGDLKNDWNNTRRQLTQIYHLKFVRLYTYTEPVFLFHDRSGRGWVTYTKSWPQSESELLKKDYCYLVIHDYFNQIEVFSIYKETGIK